MASSIYFLDLKGKILISRDYRGDIPSIYVERFLSLISESDDTVLASPCFTYDGVHVNLFFMS